MSKFCHKCIFWESGVILSHDGEFGCCHHTVANTMVITDREDVISEADVMYTKKFFGCVYHQPGEYTIIKVTDQLNT